VEERPIVLPDGGLIFDAAINVRDLEAQYNIALPEDPAYETVGGYVLSGLGVIPRGGESFEDEGYRFTVMEMDRLRVSRVKIQRLPQPAQPASSFRPGESHLASHAEHQLPEVHHGDKERRPK
jgi:CBS domain containing-hemolysin-like protein